MSAASFCHRPAPGENTAPDRSECLKPSASVQQTFVLKFGYAAKKEDVLSLLLFLSSDQIIGAFAAQNRSKQQFVKLHFNTADDNDPGLIVNLAAE